VKERQIELQSTMNFKSKSSKKGSKYIQICAYCVRGSMYVCMYACMYACMGG